MVGQSALPIRFYAGAPLITSSGHRIGAMCVTLHCPELLLPREQCPLRVLSQEARMQTCTSCAAHVLGARLYRLCPPLGLPGVPGVPSLRRSLGSIAQLLELGRSGLGLVWPRRAKPTRRPVKQNKKKGRAAARRRRGRARGRCLADTQPRRLTVDDYRVLNNCAEMVVRRLEAEQFAGAHAGAAHTLLRSLEAFKRGVLLCDMAARGWRILYANEAWSKATGAAPCSTALCGT